MSATVDYATRDVELDIALALRCRGWMEGPSGQCDYVVIAWDIVRETYVIASWAGDREEAEQERAGAESDPAYEDAEIWRRA